MMVDLDDKIKNTKEKLSKFCLDVVAKLPRFQGSWIARLQDLRERQNKEAAEYLEKSKRPEGNDLALGSLYIYELYFLEDFPKLEKSLFNIYAKQKKKGYDAKENINRYKEFINRASGSFSFGSWQDLGWISSEDKKGKYLPSFIKAYFKDFPREFEHIKLELYHILPSVIIVSFNITFEKEVNKKIESMISSKWHSKITFSSVPWKYGYSMTSSEQEKEKAIYNYVKNLRAKAENFIGKYFKGYFLSNKKNFIASVCPSVEVFNMSELPQGEELDKKTAIDRGFWHSMGFEWYLKPNIFKTDNLLFFSATHGSYDLNYPPRLIILKKGLNTNMHSSIESAIYDEAFYFLQGYANSIVLFELCNKMMDRVGKLRVATGENIFLKRFSPGRFTRLLRLNESIDREIFVLDRLVSEYEHIRKNELEIWKHDQIDAVQLSKSQKKLSDCFLNSIDAYIGLIKKQYDTTQDTFKNYLSGLNLGISYRLQRRILFLTVILVIGLLAQIFLALPQEIRLKIWIKLINIFK